ncbi:leucine--tRNA ligase [Candidatus Saccharibacteria bacterium]|nr:leucine--tRNA ligase [Candidatus Saccharibacteria bacterium]
MKHYDALKIEAKWQDRWEKEATFRADDKDKRPKFYLAEMFPYPSAHGLHVGHVRNFSIIDCLTRFYSQKGFNVLRPFGYDTFGLPAENYAIKTGISPQEATRQNVENFRKQAKRLGFAIDWSREINTSDPEYYRWTQWCFLKLYEKGLAYRAESYQWWCSTDQTVLANEQVEDGRCWRCGNEVTKRKMKQWYFKITEYADELLEEIDSLDWPDRIKTMQKNWIGRSEGANIRFKVDGDKYDIEVFTTRPDTLFGATFLVLAPEHELLDKIVTNDARAAVDKYRKDALKKSEIERQENRDKTGVFTGAYAINPATNSKIPIWVSDYVLSSYGLGAIMAVPAHDERDYEFASRFKLPIIRVIDPVDSPESSDDHYCYHGEGVLVNSGEYNGCSSQEARKKILNWLTASHIGHAQVTYRMRDWLISRQRYWGCPIPIAYDKQGNAHPIPVDQLPVTLPAITDYAPDQSGRSALAKAQDFVKCKLDGEAMLRETDTLDGYACSSWYLWRYLDPHNSKQAWSPKLVNQWAPLDIYCGGDHAVAHLLYVRFWCKFFADEGLLSFREPIKKLLYNGYINGPDGRKMSKSKGNVIDPLDVIDDGYGADTLRTYELFIGPYDMDASWSTEAIGGVFRFLGRFWSLCFTAEHLDGADAEHEYRRHKTIKKVTEDIQRTNFNTAVAALMEYLNYLYKNGAAKNDLVAFARLLKPFAPHLASEVLEEFSADDAWPTWDEDKLVTDVMEVIVQVNGKLRAKLTLAAEEVQNRDLLIEKARADAKVQQFIGSKELVKTIALPERRLVNFVVK